MDKVSIQMRVIFEDPFWIAIFERNEKSLLTVSKVIFGAEPKDYEVYQWVLTHYHRLKFSPPVTNVVRNVKLNPKKMQRDIKKQINHHEIGTKSQQALKLQQVQIKANRSTSIKRSREEEKQRLYDLKQQKRKEKHRGR